jgi:alpha-tubulin suppressor-like RCC1 family protein
MRRLSWIVVVSALPGALGACRGQPSSPVPPAHLDASAVPAQPDAAQPAADGGAADASSPRDVSRAPLLGADDKALCIVEGNVMRRWGKSLWGGPDHPRPEVTTFPERVARLACGTTHTCVVTEGGDIWCLGYSGFGDLGVMTGEVCPGVIRDSECSSTPVKVPGLPKMVDVAVGGGLNCGVSEAGEVYGWGAYAQSWRADARERADAGAHRPEAVFRVPGLTDVRRVDVGGDHACALDGRGEIWCWGRNPDGQLGRGTFTDREPRPARVLSIHGASSMAVNGDHDCALVEGAVQCWGFNGLWAVNDKVEARCEDRLPCAPSPRRVALPGAAKIVDVPRAGASTCVLDALGAAYCWGANRDSALGPGGEPCEMQPCLRRPRKLLGLPPLKQLLGSGSFLCGLTAGRELLCWGDVAGELRVPPGEEAQCPECVGPLFRLAL